jgi:subtilisin family serine protease
VERTSTVAVTAESEVVVALSAPALAHAPASETRIAAEQRAFRRALSLHVPDARVRWRYQLVANGFGVVVPSGQVQRLLDLPGVRAVFEAAHYTPQLDTSPQQIGAPGLWGQGLETAGQGVKIGVIDTGVDQSHTFFDPSGYTMPAGFPKGQTRFTTAKVIAARASSPPATPAPRSRVTRADSPPSPASHRARTSAITRHSSEPTRG